MELLKEKEKLSKKPLNSVMGDRDKKPKDR